LFRGILWAKNDQKKGEQKMKSMTNTNLYKRLPAIFAGAILMLVAQGVLAGQTFTVTNTNDSGAGSLRQAIESANSDYGVDYIAFNIPGSGPHTIQPLSPLPHITNPVIIDGYTQAGAAPAIDDAQATLIVELDGIKTGDGSVSGLIITAGNSIIRGLVINRFGDVGIHIQEKGSNIIEGNYIGTDVTGTLERSNFDGGVRIWDAPNNRIGGGTPEARNVILGYVAILLPGAIGNEISGNYIGTDATGTAALENGAIAVRIYEGASYNTIGPGNVISGNGAVFIYGGANYNTIGPGNVISGNGGAGIEINGGIVTPNGVDVTGNHILGNFIGTDASGREALGNSSAGVRITSCSDNTVTDNTVSNNGYGIRLESSSDNQIYNNNFIDNTIQAYATNGRRSNIFSLDKPIGGNYWSDWTKPDADGDGFVDSAYVFTGGVDNLPWARQDGWLPTPGPILPDIAVTDPNLVAWYRFDGDASDNSGNDLHGREMGDPTYEAGVFGQAIRLDGDGDYVDCGLAPEFDITDFISFTYWIKVVKFDKGWNTVLSKGDNSWRSSRAAANNFMEAAVTGTTGDYTYGVTPVDDGQWHHVGFVYDGKSNYLYVDGEVDATERSSGQINVSSYPLWIGDNSQAPGMFWNGLIDEVQIYNRALNQEEIQVIMQGEEFPYAFNPEPADGAKYVSANVELSWSSGSCAQLHIVYFGDNFDDVNNDPGGILQETTTYTPGPLESNKVYYWRIDEFDGVVIHKGNVWSFTVADPVSEALVSGSHMLE
jgi:parallel beta-helix repeat protein